LITLRSLYLYIFNVIDIIIINS